MEYTTEQLISKWERLLPAIVTEDITLEFFEVDSFDSQFADYLLEKPATSIYCGEQALLNLTPPDLVDQGAKPKLRINNLPEANRIPIRDLRAEHLGKFIALEGTVRNTTEVRPRRTIGVCQCLRCYAYTKIPQDTLHEEMPLECTKEQSGCGRSASSTAFKWDNEKSTFIDAQRVELMELSENIGTDPEALMVLLLEDQTGILHPGYRVIINGVLKMSQRKKTNIFDIFLDANSIELKEHDEVNLSEEDEERCINLSKNPDVYEIITNSFSPTIYGYEVEKFTLLLQAFSGVTKLMPDGTKLRGWTNILLIGDPGTAKSQLADYAIKLSAISGKVSGKNATPAGLTATVEKDTDFGGGRWTLKPGGLILANNGVYCIDEVDKLDKSALDSLHEPMEQGTVSIAKATITAQMNANTSILAVANPKFGRFDEYKPIPEQVTLPTAFLSRFDVIFPIKDKVDKARDTELSKHILSAHQAGEINENIKEYGQEFHSKEDYESKVNKFARGIGRKFLRKYIMYSKRIMPVMKDDSLQRLSNYYVSLRSKGDYEGTISCTPRQLEGLVRLAEACSRMRLSNIIEDCDIDRVIGVCDYYLSKVANDKGITDIDMIATGTATSTRQKVIQIVDVIKKDPNGVYIEFIAEETNIDVTELESLLDKMNKEGRIFYQKDKWRLV